MALFHLEKVSPCFLELSASFSAFIFPAPSINYKIILDKLIEIWYYVFVTSEQVLFVAFHAQCNRTLCNLKAEAARAMYFGKISGWNAGIKYGPGARNKKEK